MTTVTKFPIEKTYPRTVRGKEVWAQQEPPEEMVWAVCPYTDGQLKKCRHCPKWIEEDGAAVSRGCYVFAAEVCRVVFAMQGRAKQPLSTDSGCLNQT